MVYDSSLSSDSTVTAPNMAPGFPLQSHCYHSRWSQHYREHARSSCLGDSGDEELSPWLATKLKGGSGESTSMHHRIGVYNVYLFK